MLFVGMCARDRHSLLRFVFPVSVSRPFVSLENSENLNYFTPDENEKKSSKFVTFNNVILTNITVFVYPISQLQVYLLLFLHLVY